MKRPVRRGFVALWPYALAAAIAYGMVASALAVPMAYRGAPSGPAGDCRLDAGSAPAAVEPVRIAARGAADDGRTASARAATTRDRDAHADHAPHVATETPEAPASDGDGGPASDPFDCCTTRLGTCGTLAAVQVWVRRLEPEARRLRAPRPRMPSRPRPWRVSLGRHPPLLSPAPALVA